MKRIQLRKIVVLLLPICIFSCTDKDREMARNTKDGTENFVYHPTEVNENAATKSVQTGASAAHKILPPTPQRTSSAPEAAPVKPQPPDRFEYKPDPRLLRQMSKKSKSE